MSEVSKYNGQNIEKMLKKDLVEALITLGHAFNAVQEELHKYIIRDRAVEFNNNKNSNDEYGEIDNNVHAGGI